MEQHEIALRMEGLVVFRGLLKDPVVAAFMEMLRGSDERRTERMSRYGAFCAALFAYTENWSDYLLEAVLEDENLYVVKSCTAAGVGPQLKRSLELELEFLAQAARVTSEEMLAGLPGVTQCLPQWETSTLDFAAAYRQRMNDVNHKGYGIFARYHVFTLEDGHLAPVKYPDPQRLDQLPGYEREREKVIANTKALLAGQPANNVLLYGDAGTGKSSSIKAIANEFAGEGLRLVEIKKNQLYQLPELMDSLAANPLKFILFIDDLSFTANDDNFAALKAILEGSVGGRSQNLVVYATSNRRHLIKETMSDREGDDIHHGDTMQELMSLSARFGLTVTYSRPDKERFEQIVLDLAAQYGLQMPADRLMMKAEAFAIRSGGRSPRVAKQFVELCKAGVQM